MHILSLPALCALSKDSGACSNYTVKWYFDVTYGDCSRFWYGGCDGNENRYDSRAECEDSCIKPEEDETGEIGDLVMKTDLEMKMTYILESYKNSVMSFK